MFRLVRLLQIQWIFAKHGLDKVALSHPLFSPIRFLSLFNPWNWSRKSFNRGIAIREAIEDLGPVFVKFGQALSTRQDLLPEDIAFELKKLQDRVPPFSAKQARNIVESTYQQPLNEIFSQFDDIPLASASIAQVHAARLLNGKEVVVKILRPDIEKKIKQDVALMYTIADLLRKYWRHGKRLRAREIVEEFEKTTLDELDFMREAANASTLKRNFSQGDLLYIPDIYWPYVGEKVMVMERIYGIPISDLNTLREYQINCKALAERGVEIFFTQVFRDCFFHADMHPGNIFVDPSHPENPTYIAVDFGIVGSLSETDKHYLAQNLMAFFHRDYRQVARLHVESGWVPKQTRVEEFEAAIRTVCEPIFERPLAEISCAQLILRLFQVGRRFHMEVQPQLVLLQKTLFAIEGLGRQLYPQLDLWSTAKPYLEKWLKQQVNPMTLLNALKEQAPFYAQHLPEMPALFFDVLTLSRQEMRSVEDRIELAANKMRSEEKAPRGFAVGVGVAFVFIALLNLLFNLDFSAGKIENSLMTLSLIAGGFVALLFARRKK